MASVGTANLQKEQVRIPLAALIAPPCVGCARASAPGEYSLDDRVRQRFEAGG